MKSLFFATVAVSFWAVGIGAASELATEPGAVPWLGDAAAGKAKAAACAGCHGPDGNSPSELFPKIAGQHASYIAKQLADYKSGVRENPTMSSMAAALSEADMHDLGAYFSDQPVKAGVAQSGPLERGSQLYRGGDREKRIPACMSCHDPRGSGNAAAAFPALSGQHSTYTEATLKAFRAGERANDRAAMMRTIAGRMSNDDIAAVAQYVAGLY